MCRERRILLVLALVSVFAIIGLYVPASAGTQEPSCKGGTWCTAPGLETLYPPCPKGYEEKFEGICVRWQECQWEPRLGKCVNYCPGFYEAGFVCETCEENPLIERTRGP